MKSMYHAFCRAQICIGIILGAFAITAGCTTTTVPEESTAAHEEQYENESELNASIIGMYPIEFSDAWFQKYWVAVCEDDGSYYGLDDEERAEAIAEDAEWLRENMDGLHVLEIEADRPITRSDLGQISQDEERGSFSQVPYLEVWIDEAGRPIDSSRLRSPETNRVAFYLHFVDREKPLYTPWGKLELPAPSKLPKRLRRFLAYELP